MSIAIIDNSASGAGPRVRRVFPVMTGLAAVLYMGTDAPTSLKNQVSRGATPGVLTGTPFYTSSHISLSGTTHIDFDALAEQESFTIITTMKPTGDLSTASVRPNIAGWFQNSGSTPQGAGIFVSSATGLRAVVPYLVSGSPVSTNLNISSYAAGELLVERLVALSVRAGVDATLYDLTKNIQTSAATTNSRSLTLGRGFRIGAAFGTTGTGPVDMSKTLLFQGIGLTKAQIDQTVVSVRAYLLDIDGITV